VSVRVTTVFAEKENAAGRRPTHGHRGSVQKFREDRSSGSRDMFADRQTQTDSQTDKLIAILRARFIGVE